MDIETVEYGIYPYLYIGSSLIDKYGEARHAKTHESFIDALVAFRDKVLVEVIAFNVNQAADQSGKTGKMTAWGNRKPFNKSTSSAGQSTRMSVVAGTETDGIPLGEPDDYTYEAPQTVTSVSETFHEDPSDMNRHPTLAGLRLRIRHKA